jgi:hypothetical protein
VEKGKPLYTQEYNIILCVQVKHIGGLKKMTTLVKIPHVIRKRSNNRPKSLILLIPALIRDTMELTADDNICLEVCMENNEKILKIRKID